MSGEVWRPRSERLVGRSNYEIMMKSALLRWSESVLALVEGRESNIVAMQRA
jgi:hypothetical protein